MSIHEVLKYLPHRYPFLLIDRVLECDEGERLVAIKNVTYNEPFFTGHFPVRPVFPGVMIIEAMAQATALLSFRSMGGRPSENHLYLFTGVDNARFKRQVSPGDQLRLEVTITRVKRHLWCYSAVATVDGVVVCTADLKASLQEIKE
jgi:3-hydroxyacyl-[acyl-carrier-protein] dehydratase